MNGSQFSAEDMAEYLDLKQQAAVKSVRASLGCVLRPVFLCALIPAGLWLASWTLRQADAKS